MTAYMVNEDFINMWEFCTPAKLVTYSLFDIFQTRPNVAK